MFRAQNAPLSWGMWVGRRQESRLGFLIFTGARAMSKVFFEVNKLSHFSSCMSDAAYKTFSLNFDEYMLIHFALSSEIRDFLSD